MKKKRRHAFAIITIIDNIIKINNYENTDV